MSFGNAVRQREEMNTAYKAILKEEINPTRIKDIQDRIQLNDDEIAQLKLGKPLFGRPKPLKQTVTLIEPDHEKGGQKITQTVSVAEEKKPVVKGNKKFLANALQNQVQTKKMRASFNKKDDDDLV